MVASRRNEEICGAWFAMLTAARIEVEKVAVPKYGKVLGGKRRRDRKTL